MSSLSDKLAATPVVPVPQTRRPEHPTGREWEWDGTAGFLRTEVLAERPKTWDEFILDAGLDPTDVEVVEPVQVRGWDAPQAGGDVVRMHYYRLTLRRRNLRVDLDDLVKAAKRRQNRTENGIVSTDHAYVVAL